MKNRTIIINEDQLRRIMIEMRDASFNNSEYIISMLRDGYLAHGTTIEDLSSFDEEKIQGGFRGEYGYGFYFTDELYKCLEYGSNIYFTPKGIYNFLELDGHGEFKKIVEEYENLEWEISRCNQELDDVRTIRDYDYYEGELKKLKDKRYNMVSICMDIARRCVRQEGDSRDEYIFKYIKGQMPIGRVKELSQWLMSLGYDGVHCGKQYCIFNTEKLNSNIVE